MMMSKPKEPWSTRRGRTTVAATAANQERGERQLCPQIITLASSRLKRLEASPDVWPASGIEEVIFEMIFSALVVQDKENIVPSTAKC